MEDLRHGLVAVQDGVRKSDITDYSGFLTNTQKLLHSTAEKITTTVSTPMSLQNINNVIRFVTMLKKSPWNYRTTHLVFL
jgi:hypothetical protein